MASVRVALVASLCVVSSIACSRAVTLQVQHPSPLSRWGRELGVSAFGDDDNHLAAIVASGLDASPAFDVVQGAGQRMRVLGRVEQRQVDPERVSSRATTCVRMVNTTVPRSVPVTVGYPPRTVMQTSSIVVPVPQPYACTQLVRSVTARARLRISVNALTRPIRQVYGRAFSVEDTARTTGLEGSDAEDHAPPPIDSAALLRDVEERTAQAFLDDVLPRSEAVEVDFGECGPRCDVAVSLARRGDLTSAARTFGQVVEELEATPARLQTPEHRSRLAAALFNRGVVRGYTDDLPHGLADVQRAIQLGAQPSWHPHLQRLQSLQAERQRARFRGETRRLSR